MFKCKRYFCVNSIRVNSECHNGRTYFKYMPIVHAMGFLNEAVELFNQEAKKDVISICFNIVENDQTCYLTIVGSQKYIDEFVSSVLIVPDFTRYFSWNKASVLDIKHS